MVIHVARLLAVSWCTLSKWYSWGGGELRFMIGAQKPLNDMKHKNYIGKGEVASSDDF